MAYFRVVLVLVVLVLGVYFSISFISDKKDMPSGVDFPDKKFMPIVDFPNIEFESQDIYRRNQAIYRSKVCPYSGKVTN